MTTLMPSDTAAVLGDNAKLCDSRSLLLDRFCDPAAKDKARHSVFTRAMEKPAIKSKSVAWVAWLSESKLQKANLHAQLQSRLMVNMAGGVMENAGLCLDRFGLPYIPGSAVKGCARRAALAALREWCAAGGQPEHKPTASDNPLVPCCAHFASAAEMLATIARTFGWCEQDWSDRPNSSDLYWACANNVAILRTAAEALAAHFRWPIADHHHDTPWLSLPNFAGSVSFLPAYPVDLGKTGKLEGLPIEVPPLGTLELDVVTCHHQQYYSQEKDRQGRVIMPVALDIEDPVPVVFPAVAPGHVFTFALVPLRDAEPKLVQHACTWLKIGLQTFGLGAKTNAGYGWFDASDPVQDAVRKMLQEKARREREAREREQADLKRKAEEAERLRQKQQREAALANLTGDERADKEIELLTDAQFDAKVRAFCKDPKKGGPTEEQKRAIVRALRGPRLAYWLAFKTKATKGDLAKVVQAINQLSKQMNLGKMP